MGVNGRTIRFDDGTETDVGAVIWATGYRSDYSWIRLPVVGSDQRVRHQRGVTDIPGLYFLGLSWQYTRGSALIGWVKNDAEFITGQIENQPPSAETAHDQASTPQAARVMEGV